MTVDHIKEALEFRRDFEEALISAGRFSTLAVARYFEVPPHVIKRDLKRAGYSKGDFAKLESPSPVSVHDLRRQREGIVSKEDLRTPSVFFSIGLWHAPLQEKEEEAFKQTGPFNELCAVEYLCSVLGADVSDASAMLGIAESRCYGIIRAFDIPRYLERRAASLEVPLQRLVKEVRSSLNVCEAARGASRLTGYSEALLYHTARGDISKVEGHAEDASTDTGAVFTLRAAGLTIREISKCTGFSVGFVSELLHRDALRADAQKERTGTLP